MQPLMTVRKAACGSTGVRGDDDAVRGEATLQGGGVKAPLKIIKAIELVKISSYMHFLKHMAIHPIWHVHLPLGCSLFATRLRGRTTSALCSSSTVLQRLHLDLPAAGKRSGQLHCTPSQAPFGLKELKFNSHHINVLSNAWSTKCRLIVCISAQIRSNLRDESIQPN
jgi:hypothetical protein